MLQLINPTHLLIKVRGRNNIDPWMVYLLLVFKQPLDVTVQCVGIALEVLDIDLFVLQLLTELHLVATQVLNLVITSIGLLYKWRVESQRQYKTQNITYGKGKGFFLSLLYWISISNLNCNFDFLPQFSHLSFKCSFCEHFLINLLLGISSCDNGVSPVNYPIYINNDRWLHFPGNHSVHVLNLLARTWLDMT